MLYQVQIKVMPLKDLLDPQGKAVLGGLHNLGLSGIQDVRVGKNINLQIEGADEAAAVAGRRGGGCGDRRGSGGRRWRPG